jgi:hypothetical protein
MPKCRPIPKALKMAETEMSADTDTEISAETDTETDNFRSLSTTRKLRAVSNLGKLKDQVKQGYNRLGYVKLG